MAVEVCLSFNFAVVFYFILFPVPPTKANFLGTDLVNRRKAAIRSMFFYLFYYAHFAFFFAANGGEQFAVFCLSWGHSLKIALYLAETEIH